MGPARHDTAVQLWFDQIIRRTPHVAPSGVVRAQHRNLQCFSYHTGPVWCPCGTHKDALRHPYGHVRELTQPEIAKIPHRRRMWPCAGPVLATYTPPARTGCLRSKPIWGWKLIMHASKYLWAPCREAKFVWRHTGPVWTSCVDARFLSKTAREQPVNSTYGAQDCDVTGALRRLGYGLLNVCSFHQVKNVAV